MSVLDFIRYRLQMAKRGVTGKASVYDLELALQDNGFQLRQTIFRFKAPEVRTTFVLWADVSRIVAWKEDNYTWDTLWLTFYGQDNAECSVSEEAVGWNRLLELLPDKIAGAPTQRDWWSAVVHPAFAPNVTQIFPAPT
jgi:hypothetical protein